MSKSLSRLSWLLACAASFTAGRWLIPSENTATGSAVGPTTPGSTSGAPPALLKSKTAQAATWADRISSELDEIRRAAKPGEPNEVLVSKLRETLDVQDDALRLSRWNALLAAFTADDASAVIGIFRALDKDGRWYVQEGNCFWQKWGELAGDAAARRASAEHPGPEGYARVMRGWASQDSAAAAMWLEAHGAAQGWPMTEAATGLLDGIGERDPDAAERFLRERPEDPLFQPLLRRLAEYHIYGRGLDSAVAWFQRLAKEPGVPGALLQANLGSLTSLMAERVRDERTVSLAAPYVNEPWFPADAARALGRYFGEKDPLGGIVASEQMTGGGRAEVLGTLADRWAKDDAATMERWLASNPDHADYDALAVPLMNRVARTDNEAARRLADSLKADELRRVMTQRFERAAKPANR